MCAHAVRMAAVTNINDVLDGHVALDLVCIDRLYLNAYVPRLQVGGQVERFCKDHLGMPIASPAVIEKIGNRFRRDVDAFAKAHRIPVLHLKKPDRSRWDDRKLDHVRPYLERAERNRRWGVAAVVAAQEFQWVFTATKKTGARGGVYFDWAKTERRVSCYYFYICDREFGPSFIKICTKLLLESWTEDLLRRVILSDRRKSHSVRGRCVRSEGVTSWTVSATLDVRDAHGPVPRSGSDRSSAPG